MFRRIKINLFQKPITTIALFITFMLILAFVFFCVSMLRSYSILDKDMREMYGGVVVIGMKSGSSASYEEQLKALEEDYNPLEGICEITYENIDEILEIEGVLGVDAHISGRFSPENFENVQKYTGEDPYKQSYETMDITGLSEEEIIEQGELISLSGNIDTSMIGDFKKGWNELVDGEFPNKGKSEVIVSQELAQDNELAIGDNLELRDTDINGGNTYVFEVVGIYSTILEFKVLEENDTTGSYAISGSPYNVLYSDWESVNSITQTYSGIKNLYVYYDPSLSSDALIERLKTTSINWNEFDVRVEKGEFEAIEQGLVNFYNAMISITFIAFTGGVILFLIIILSFNEDKEIGVLVCIGEKRKNVARQKTMEYLLIAVISFPVAVLIGNFAAVILSDTLNPQAVYPDGSVAIYVIDIGELSLRPKLTASFNIIDALLVAVYALVLLLASYIINKLKVKKHNTKKFIMGEE